MEGGFAADGANIEIAKPDPAQHTDKRRRAHVHAKQHESAHVHPERRTGAHVHSPGQTGAHVQKLEQRNPTKPRAHVHMCAYTAEAMHMCTCAREATHMCTCARQTTRNAYNTPAVNPYRNEACMTLACPLRIQLRVRYKAMYWESEARNYLNLSGVPGCLAMASWAFCCFQYEKRLMVVSFVFAHQLQRALTNLLGIS